MPVKPPPQYEVQQEKAKQLKLLVCTLLQWTDEQYCWFQYRQGLTYLLHFLKCSEDDYPYRVIEKEQHFWAWWRNLYLRLDEDFLQIYPHLPPSPASLAAAYCYLHFGDIVSITHHMDRSIVAMIYKDKKLRQCKP